MSTVEFMIGRLDFIARNAKDPEIRRLAERDKRTWERTWNIVRRGKSCAN